MIDWLDELDPIGAEDAATALRAAALPAGARADLVNRTRRVVNERARTLQVRKSRLRSLYIPLAVSAGLLAAVVFAVWSVLLGYDTTNTGLPDSSQQIMVLLMWCLPVSVALLAAVWMRRAGSRFGRDADDGRPQ